MADRIFAYDNIPLKTQTYINQIEEKNKLFKEALDKFGASSKEEAVILYAEGIKERSGPLQYSVMCKKLKIDFEEKMNEEENYAWLRVLLVHGLVNIMCIIINILIIIHIQL